MMQFGKDGVTKRVGNQFKAYIYKEGKDMGVEDKMSKLWNALQRAEEAKIKIAANHEADLEYHSKAMERAHNVLMDEALKEMRAPLVRTVEVPVEVVVEVVQEVVVFKEVKVIEKVVVEKKIYVEVDVLPKGDPRPQPLFRGGQSVHQWWATWMSGSYETPLGINGKTGRPAWYSASVYS